MFEVGDIVRVPNGRFGDRYQVIQIVGECMVMRNVRQTSDNMNFTSNIFDNFIFDEEYLRKKKLKERRLKLERICSKLEI